MHQPGEVKAEIGRAYQFLFTGALEKAIASFAVQFHVFDTPEKTTFRGSDGASFSFDFAGTMRDREVFGECKGYSASGDLLQQFRHFLARAFVTSRDHARHANDLFWFISNVSFGCSEGRGLLSREYLGKALRDPTDATIRAIVGNGEIDDELVRKLAKRVSVFVLTDSYLRASNIRYLVRPGESLWTILKKLHGGEAPSDFGFLSQEIAYANNLPSPDAIKSGYRIDVRWRGFRADV